MIDICTLIVAQTMNLIGCLPPVICKPVLDNDGNTVKQYCSQAFGVCSRSPEMWHECKKSDGTVYTEPYHNELK